MNHAHTQLLALKYRNACSSKKVDQSALKDKISFELREHKEIVMIGDVHGDLMPMMAILEHAKLIKTEDMELLTRCFRSTPGNDYKKEVLHIGGSLEMERNILNRLQWIGGDKVVVFLGDILDNRRSSIADTYGVCGLPPTQQFLMKALVHLNTQALLKGGRIVWVLGNHCMANISPKYHIRLSTYAPKYFVDANSKLGDVYNNSIPTPAWREEVCKYMRELSATTFVLITRCQIPYALGLHGGLTQKFAQTAQMKESDGLGTTLDNMRLGHTKLWNDFTNMKFQLEQTIDMYPTWCRFNEIDTEITKHYMGVDIIFKGHDVQPSHNGVSQILHEPNQGQKIYTTDVGMGRSFNSESYTTTVAPLSYVELSMDKTKVNHFRYNFDHCDQTSCNFCTLHHNSVS